MLEHIHHEISKKWCFWIKSIWILNFPRAFGFTFKNWFLLSKLLTPPPNFPLAIIKLHYIFKSKTIWVLFWGKELGRDPDIYFPNVWPVVPKSLLNNISFPTDLKCHHYHILNTHLHVGLFLGFLFFPFNLSVYPYQFHSLVEAFHHERHHHVQCQSSPAHNFSS